MPPSHWASAPCPWVSAPCPLAAGAAGAAAIAALQAGGAGAGAHLAGDACLHDGHAVGVGERGAVARGGRLEGGDALELAVAEVQGVATPRGCEGDLQGGGGASAREGGGRTLGFGA